LRGVNVAKSRIVSSDTFLKEARRIAGQAQDKGIVLRVMGGVAIALHSSKYREFAERLGRLGKGIEQEFSDLDFMAFKKQMKQVIDFLTKDLGYIKRRPTISTATSQRLICFHPKERFYADIFFDKLLVANHPIDFRKRLTIDSPTISVSDLLLEKIQMWEAFGQKDLKDCLVLIRAHDVGETDEENINAKYVAKLLSIDWGFWYTATTNLRKIKKCVDKLEEIGPKVDIGPELISEEERADISNKTAKLLEYISIEKKQMKWKLRSKIGTTKKWYKHVETPEAVSGFGIWHAKEIFPENK